MPTCSAFGVDAAQDPARASGGERKRAALALAFALGADLLLFDEPTNHLDIDTLELLEQLLQDYAGTLILVGHDRTFLDKVVTQVLAAEGAGRWREYVGGYSDWLAQRPPPAGPAADRQVPAAGEAGRPRQAARTKLSYKEQRELELLPRVIGELEAEQQALAEKMHGAGYYRQDADAIRADTARSAELESLLMEQLER